MKAIYLPISSLAIALLTSCTSLNAIKQGNPLGVVSAPFELAQNIVETTSVLHGEEPAWAKQVPKTYVDTSSGAKTIFPRGYNYGSVSWNGAKDEKGYATGRGTLKTFSPSGAYAFSESGTMTKGTWIGTTKETDKQGKEWKCVWQNGFQTSRGRIYTSQELEQQRIASIERSKRQKVMLDKFGRWLGDAMSSSSSGSGGIPSDVMDCVACRDGDVWYKGTDIFGNEITKDRKCTRCNGTGWLRNGQPYQP